MVISTLLLAVAESIAAFAPSYLSFLDLLVPVGFLLMTLNTAVSAYAQTHVDEAVRGRVMAFYTVISMGGTPIGGQRMQQKVERQPSTVARLGC